MRAAIQEEDPVWGPDSELSAQLSQLDSFRLLRTGWDSYDAEPPNEAAIANARRILQCLWSRPTSAPFRLVPSVEGGVGIVFSGGGKKYADMECFNDGEILAITSEGSEPTVWTIGEEADSVRKAIEILEVL
jgi:hypothetical protein